MNRIVKHTLMSWLILFLLTLRTMPAHAAILTVTNLNNSGAGSLRNQIAAANPGDTINFSAGLSGQTITLTNTRTAPTQLPLIALLILALTFVTIVSIIRRRRI